MFKLFALVFAAMLAVVVAEPGVIAGGYAAPIAAVGYSGYAAPLAYSGYAGHLGYGYGYNAAPYAYAAHRYY